MNRGTGKIASVESLEELAREMGKLDPDVEPLVGPNGRFCWYRKESRNIRKHLRRDCWA